MRVDAIQKIRQETKWPYRVLLKRASVSYGSFMRWKSRVAKGVAVINPPGPKKDVQLDLESILAEVRQMKHEGKRSRGTAALYRAHQVEISRRRLQTMVAQERQRLNAERRAQMRRIDWLVPGMTWAMDTTEVGPVQIQQVQDLASRYKFDPLMGSLLRGVQIAEHLEQLIELYGAPLILKRDRGGILKHESVQEVLAKHLIVPLDSPPRYPCYNGGIEYAQRELKAWLRERYPGAQETLAAQSSAIHELNHQPKPCLQGRVPCAVLQESRAAMKPYTRPKRKEVIDWIKKEVLVILQSMGGRASVRACDAAWRQAVETWLHRNGAIAVSVNGEVLPCYPEKRSH
jgi:transposase InsO family protein